MVSKKVRRQLGVLKKQQEFEESRKAGLEAQQKDREAQKLLKAERAARACDNPEGHNNDLLHVYHPLDDASEAGKGCGS